MMTSRSRHGSGLWSDGDDQDASPHRGDDHGALRHCAVPAAELPANDYPTIARADYVFGCMQVNGQTRDALERCSCSIDVIASLLPFEQYEEAETVMRVRQRGGKNASMFLSMPMLRAKVDELKRAQVEAELRCF